jgi:hypothetical protein
MVHDAKATRLLPARIRTTKRSDGSAFLGTSAPRGGESDACVGRCDEEQLKRGAGLLADAPTLTYGPFELMHVEHKPLGRGSSRNSTAVMDVYSHEGAGWGERQERYVVGDGSLNLLFFHVGRPPGFFV